VFGKQHNTNTIDLSDIAYGIGGFFLDGQSAGDQSGWSVSSAGSVPCLPNTTYDLPAFVLPLGLAVLAPTIKSSNPSPLTSPALETDQPL
jgi:hypothetical protein